MKKATFAKFLVSAVLMGSSALFLNSCKKDPCKEVVCENAGVPTEINEDECECDCPAGYEGVSCETESRTRVVGSYNVTSSCTSGSYNSTISNSSTGADKIILGDFSHLVCASGAVKIEVTASIEGNTITIPSQTNCDATFSGTGTINGNVITFNITAQPSGGAAESCTETWTKK